ncbi:uncharacterized protein LOC120209930 [Hibiscus syriacus]|uniref:uncharacterized protein LOC120209930 n=1 Tax=Hibiscus syriacus TaxID=106335 RepID=UPI0019229624|nr:uncharacterized protein LOC120209930 [Hibiscus syriacus]
MNTSGGTSIGWMQFYEQTSADEVSAPSPGFSDATAVTASIVSSSKPIRLRPRVSKRKPTTLLNADASNFRALVQQFTGCPATHVSANRRCPINLNFALGKEHNVSGTATCVMPAAGNHYYYKKVIERTHLSNSSKRLGMLDKMPCLATLAVELMQSGSWTNLSWMIFLYRLLIGTPLTPMNMQMMEITSCKDGCRFIYHLVSLFVRLNLIRNMENMSLFMCYIFPVNGFICPYSMHMV